MNFKVTKIIMSFILFSVICISYNFVSYAEEDGVENQSDQIVMGSNETAELIDSGDCGDDVNWYFYSDGTLKIAGNGAITSAPWKSDYRAAILLVNIETGVTAICDYAFADCSGLQSVNIPSGVTQIGDGAFGDCANLSSITIPSSVVNIGYSVFYGCTAIKTAGPIGGGYNYEFGWTDSIPQRSFDECRGLQSINIPSGITQIGDWAFSVCVNLCSITIPDSVVSIGLGAFSGCTAIKTAGPIGGGYDYEFGWTDSIPQGAFYYCSGLQSINIPSGITKIGDYAFAYCSGLQSINIPSGVTQIGDWAFWDCANLSSITIPNSVVNIGYSVFDGCTAIKTAGPIGGGYDYEFGWTDSIPQSAFRDCVNISYITIPNSVVSIGLGAFDGCTAIKTAGPIGGGYNYEFGWTDFIPQGAFCDCSGLQSVNIPSGVTQIGDYAFYECSGLQSVNIPSGVTQIGDYAFAYCSGLQSVNIPSGVTQIGHGTFWDCANLSNITIPNSVVSIGSSAFEDCVAIKTAGPIGGGYDYEFGWTDSIPQYAFDGCRGLQSINIPSGITQIGDYAFQGCVNISSITIPNSVVKIGSYVFDGCIAIKTAGPIGGGYNYEFGWTETLPYQAFMVESLEKIVIPGTITTIDSNIFSGNKLKTAGPIGGGYDYEFGWTNAIPDIAFVGCNKLTSIVLPETITSIGALAFDGCESLTIIEIPNKVTQIGNGAFRDCSSISKITIPDGVSIISRNLFWGCRNLTDVTIPNGVTRIENGAFNTCSKLENIEIPESVTYIGSYVFANCELLKKIVMPYSLEFIGNMPYGYYGYDRYIKYNDVSIIGYKNTIADQYAADYGINFEAINISITYNLDGGNNDTDNVECFYTKNGNLVLNAPQKQGFIFDGWYTDSLFRNRLYEVDENRNDDLVLYAKWKYVYSLYGYKVIIDSNFDLKYILEIADEVKNDRNSFIEFTVGNQKQTVKYSSMSGTYATYICEVPTKCIGDTINARLYFDGEYYELTNFSIKSYLENLIENKNNIPEYADAKELAEAILTYGAYSQLYFNYNIDSLSNVNVSNDLVKEITDQQIIDDIDFTKKYNNNDDFSFIGASLICNSDTYMRIYLTNSNNLTLDEINEKYNCYVAGGSNPEIEIGLSAGVIYLECKNIPAAELDNIYIFVMESIDSEVMIKYSPYMYIEEAMNSQDESLKNLCKALYLYCIEANKYYNKYSMPA